MKIKLTAIDNYSSLIGGGWEGSLIHHLEPIVNHRSFPLVLPVLAHWLGISLFHCAQTVL